MATALALSSPAPALEAAAHASSDDQLLAIWLHGRSQHTQRAYRADVERFRVEAGRPLRQIMLPDLQQFADALGERAPASRYRTLSALKSLLAFGHRIGYLPFDVGRALRLPPVRNRLAERILPEADLHRILSLEPDPRNRALLVLLYASGFDQRPHFPPIKPTEPTPEGRHCDRSNAETANVAHKSFQPRPNVLHVRAIAPVAHRREIDHVPRFGNQAGVEDEHPPGHDRVGGAGGCVGFEVRPEKPA